MKELKRVALLEYDGEDEAVFEPDHEHLEVKLPEVAVFAFVGEVVDVFAKEMHAVTAAKFVSITKEYPIYIVSYKGRDICLCQAPCGAAPATQILDWLIAYGVKKIISTGSCGVLQDISENAFLIPEKALRDEGTSFHYLQASRYVELDSDMVKLIEEYFTVHNIPYEKCVTWTTDGFFRETKKKVISRKEEGCSAVDMECSALAACAQFRKVKFGQFFFTADSLHKVDSYDKRGRGINSMQPAIHLAMEIARDSVDC